jgi:hypothetical protein
MVRFALLAAFAAAALGLAPAALAQAPPNDNRATAQRLGAPPVTVAGTTVGATRDFADPACAPTTNSVWYRLDGTREGRLIVRLDAADDVDLAIVVLRRIRSETQVVACRNTDAKGNANFSFGTADEGNYLLMVAQRFTSQPGSFRLTLLVPEQPERAPGKALPRRGVTASVDALLDGDDAWSTVLRPAQTYRINLVTGRERCLSLALYGPRTRSFGSAAPLRSSGCGGYLTYTPGPSGGGRYSLRVLARGGERGELRYRLQVAPAGRDDTSPGLPLRNLEQRSGLLSGRSVDVVDLYRFQVGARSDVVLTLAAGERMQTDLALLNDRGRDVRCACLSSGGARLRLQLRRGRYFLAVRSREHSGGRYRLRLLVREITKTGVAIDGRRGAFTTPGRSVVLSAKVAPGRAGGRVRFQIDRFDPFQGWVFARFVGAAVGADGVARVVWTPPSVGRWRVSARFRGTITRSPSRSGNATLLVGEPL